LTTNAHQALYKKRKKAKKEESSAQNDFDSAVRFSQADGQDLDVNSESAVSEVLFCPGLKLHLLGQSFDVRRNPPLVEKLSLPGQAMSGFTTYPKKLNMQFADRQKS